MARPLRIGVQLPEVERVVPWPEMREMAVTAEAVGFDSLWVGDHLLYREESGPVGPWEAWSMLAALAAVTERIKLGPLVAATSFHNPTMLAKKAATVNEIANGRLILGLGAGWNQTEYDAFGFPFDRRASRFEEAFTIIRTLVAGDTVDFHGEFYEASDCVLAPPPKHRMPIMIGSEGPRVLSIALPHAQIWNGWHAWYGNTPEGAAELNAKVDIACDGVGIDPPAIERTVTVLVRTPWGTDEPKGSPNRRSSHPIGGSQSEVAEQLAAFASVGMDEVQLVVDPITTASIEWLGDVLAVLDG